MKIGDRIKFFRKARDWTQIELAEKAKISKLSIHMYECDKCSPNIKQLHKIALALNFPITYFLDASTDGDVRGTSASKRVSKEGYYLKIAETVAIRSTCLKHKYGAVIVNDDAIVSTGYNGSPRGEANCCEAGACRSETHDAPLSERAAAHGNQYGTCVAIHAEQNALIHASRKELKGATLYLACLSDKPNISPCNICDRMIRNAGISKIVTNGGGQCKRQN